MSDLVPFVASVILDETCLRLAEENAKLQQELDKQHRMARETFPVTIKSYPPLTLTCRAFNTIGEIKSKIVMSGGAGTVDMCRLIYGGRLLMNDELLADIGFHSGNPDCVLHIVLRLRGGSRTRRVPAPQPPAP